MKIISIIGARPQFIKAMLLSRKLDKKGIKEKLVHTGQHYDTTMSDVFFLELDIPHPSYNLKIGAGTHAEQTGKILLGLEPILLAEKPDLVLVYGDTNTTLGGALVAAKLNIPVCHIEAGLRSFNKTMPEEINRILTDHISSLLFPPTQTAWDNLKTEGIAEKSFLVGDVMLDAAILIDKKFNALEEKILNKHHLKKNEYILATIHRAENTDSRENLQNIWESFQLIAEQGIKIIFPCHPRTSKALDQFELLSDLPRSPNLIFIDPIGYREMIQLEKTARMIITDSGGVQKEGYFFKIPCLVIRNETEWTELVESGWNRLVNKKKDIIVEQTLSLFNRGTQNSTWKEYFGKGNASELIANHIAALNR